MIFTIKNRIIKCDDERLIGDNADYIAHFYFDEEWSGKIKTARFIMRKKYVDVILNDDSCTIPAEILKNGDLHVGVFANEMVTTSCVVFITPSVKEENGNTIEPPYDVYSEIIKMIDELSNKGVTSAQIKTAIADYIAENPIKGVSDEEVNTAVEKYVTDKGYLDEETGKTFVADTLRENLPTIPQLASNIYMGSQTSLVLLKSKVDEEVIRCRKIGIKRIVPNPRVAYSETKGFYFGVGDFAYDITDILDYVIETYPDMKADAIKISTKVIKELFVNGTDVLRQQYIEFITTVSTQLKPYNLEYFTIANESYQMYANADNEQMMLDCISAVQSQGIKCGITTEGQIDVSQVMESILQALDIIAINCYPVISFNGLSTTYDDCNKGWKSIGLSEWITSFYRDYGKKIMISETGIRDYMQFFTSSYDGDAEISDNVEKSDSMAMAKWLYGLFEMIKDDAVPIYRIQLWFLDNINISSQMTYLKNVIVKYREVK